MASARFEIDKFTGTNDFGLWRIKMKALLVQQGIYQAIDREELEELGDDKKKIREIEAKAHSAILLSLGDEVLREVSDETTAINLWEKLSLIYLKKSLANKLYLKKKLYTLKMEDSKDLRKHLDEFNRIVLDLSNIGVKIEDEDQGILLLSSLPKCYEHFVDTILYGKDTLTMSEVKAALNSKEIQKKSEERMDSNGEGMFVKSKSGSKDSKGGNHKSSNKNSNPRSNNNSQRSRQSQNANHKTNKQCYYCKKEGHFRDECRALKAKLENEKKRNSGDAGCVLDGYESADALVASCKFSNDEWILDSGCSFHMTPNKFFFCSFKDQDSGSVLLGDNKACKIAGIGSVLIKMHDGSERVISDVRYVPNLKRNLLSIGALTLKGCSIKIDSSLRVLKGQTVVMKGNLRNGIYYLEGKTISGNAATVIKSDNIDQTKLWHMRLGHVSERGLYELERQGILKGKLGKKLDFCENCVYGKSCRLKFPKARHTTTEKLDYLHSDLWGASKTKTIGGASYFLSIIDDYTRKVWVFLLKNKSDSFNTFVNWKTLIENQTGKKIKMLRTDNGLEFCSDEFNRYCQDVGIRRHNTVIKTPQQNGIAERMNRTLIERVRCMLNAAGLGKQFWGEALKTACYLINRSPSTALNFKTPQEYWTGQPPGIDHLRIFGCTAYAHIRQDKLEPRALKCCFIGYPDGVKGYKLWCLEEGFKKCMISRDVVFNEAEMPMKKSNAGPSKQTDNNENVQIHVEDTQKDDQARNTEVDQEEEEETDPDDTQGYQLIRDRERRTIRPPSRFGFADCTAFALASAEEVSSSVPRTYDEAINCKDRRKWQVAIDEEMASLMKNNTWVVVTKPPGHKLIGCKWIFKEKEGLPGEEIRYKARLVAKGFSQKEGIDFNDIFSPVVKQTSIRIMMAKAAKFDLDMDQMDVKTAFLHGKLEEEIYMAEPDGFKSSKPNQACLLLKSLYGLKQAPRQWNLRFHEFMTRNSFNRSNYDPCVYYNSVPIWLLLYVDDILIIGKDRLEINRIKKLLGTEFEMKDMGEAKRILGIDIRRERPTRITLSQRDYIQKVLVKFCMSESKPVTTPLAPHFKLSQSQSPETEEEKAYMDSIPYASCVGSLMYCMVCTRPDLAYGLSMVSRFISDPGNEHWSAVKWILRYLKGTMDVGLEYNNNSDNQVEDVTGYVDSDYAGSIDTRRSITGYAFTVLGGCVSWKSNLQKVVALSSTEAEYMAATEAIKEAIWLKGITTELGFNSEIVLVHCDNQSALHLMKNPMFHERSKHIDIKLHFIRDVIAKGEIQVKKIGTKENPADMLTKYVPLAKFRLCLNLLNILSC